MNIYLALTILMSLSAGFAYFNQRVLKFPFVIGLFFLSTILSVFVISSRFWLDIPLLEIKNYINDIRIDKIILNYLLGFLLFAGSLHTNWNDLKSHIKPIALFALGGVFASTLIVSLCFYEISFLLQVHISFIYCLLFGALISPTDPIAVLGILTKANVPKKTEYIILGESLFNDGVGVVLFIAFLDAVKNGTFNFPHFGFLLIQEAGGGIIMGFFLGYCLLFLLKSIDHFETEILLTVAFVMVGYSLCNYFNSSGALAMVVMGLMVGNFKEEITTSHDTQDYVNKFWELVDVILNAILFILIAFVIIVLDFKAKYIILGFSSILIVLLSRIIIVYAPYLISKNIFSITRKEAKIITWGGLRGGLSLALVLSLPNCETKSILLIVTYFCVLFSIIFQGLTIGKIARNN